MDKELITLLSSREALLSRLTVTEKELRKIRYFRGDMYSSFVLPSSGAKQRVISAPNKRLKFIQRSILEFISAIYIPKVSVHGYVVGRSVKSNALAHVRTNYIVNIDLKDFFPSITEARVAGLFSAIGASNEVAEIISILTCLAGSLPQGAPTSPIIANMICRKMDRELFELARELGMIYTRYADDITFSSFRPPNRLFSGALPSPGSFQAEQLAGNITTIIQTNGFNVNSEKLRYGDKQSRRVVTGIKVNSHLNIDRRYIRNVRAALHSVEALGITAAQARFQAEYGGTCSLSTHLRGKINWIFFIKGENNTTARSLALRYNRNFPNNQIPVPLTADQFRAKSVWIVEHEGGAGSQGTCFFLNSIGLVTSFHCVDYNGRIEIYHPSDPDSKHPVRVVISDPESDLALLAHDLAEGSYTELEIRGRDVTLGETAISLGYPDFARGDAINARPGAATSVLRRERTKKIEFTGMISNGMSGGPLVDGENRVLGVNQFGGRDLERNFAVHFDEIVRLARRRQAPR